MKTSNNRVVITGRGIISPCGFTSDEFWNALINKKSFIKEIDRFNISSFPCKAAGVIENFDRKSFGIKKYLSDQMDISSLYALAASQNVFNDARVDEKINRRRIGIYYGTNLGGRTFAERELYNLYSKGPEYISTYQAIADFNAATLGQISIKLGIKGCSKTFVTDLAASHDAIVGAYKALYRNDADLILTGGTESVISAFGFLCVVSSGNLSAVTSNFETAYRPFDKDRTGMFVGEGSAFLMLERLEHANNRVQNFISEIKGYGRTSSGSRSAREDKENALSRAIEKALNMSGLTTDDISYIKACGYGTKDEDSIEAGAIKKVFKEKFASLPITAPHSSFGHMQGAMGAFDLLIADLSIKNNQVPPTVNFESTEIDDELNIVKDTINTKVENVLIIGMGNGGVYNTIVVGKAKK